MSSQRLKDKNAKVEGRDPPEPARETMAPLRALTAKLLKMPTSKVKEQQERYEKAQENPQVTGEKRKKLGVLVATPLAKLKV